MTIEAGTRLGSYEVVAPIGAGSMGEVYKAEDTRLDRTVAIKVLPEHLKSPERKARDLKLGGEVAIKVLPQEMASDAQRLAQ